MRGTFHAVFQGETKKYPWNLYIYMIEINGENSYTLEIENENKAKLRVFHVDSSAVESMTNSTSPIMREWNIMYSRPIGCMWNLPIKTMLCIITMSLNMLMWKTSIIQCRDIIILACGWITIDERAWSPAERKCSTKPSSPISWAKRQIFGIKPSKLNI